MLSEQIKHFTGLEEMLIGFAHPYRMSSHLLHADETGVGIVAERASRSTSELNKAELAHFSGLMSYAFYYQLMCGYCICKYLKEDPKPLFEIYKALTPVFNKVDGYARVIFEGPDYDKFT